MKAYRVTFISRDGEQLDYLDFDNFRKALENAYYHMDNIRVHKVDIYHNGNYITSLEKV